MSEAIAIALVGLCGVAIGAGLQALLSYWMGKRQQVRKERFDAYQAFWSAVSRNFTTRRFDWAEVSKDEILRKACFELGIYGSKSVIRAVSALIESTGVHDPWFDQLRLYEVIRAMRKDLNGFSDRGIKTDIYITMSAGILEHSLDGDRAIKEEK